MQKVYLLLYCIIITTASIAQTVFKVSPGTNLFISANTIFTADSFSITPSTSFNLQNVSFSKYTNIAHAANNSYIARVYGFSATTASFSGSLQVTYRDAELNGIAEADLRLNIHNGTYWQSFSNNTNNSTANTVLTNAISGIAFNEIALASVGSALPLKWGPVLAYRHQEKTFIEWTTRQENNVDYFDVQKSTDGKNFMTVLSNIAATNTSNEQSYRQEDVYDAGRIYYRIKQTDTDGKFSFSSIATIAAENSTEQLLLYPNPVAGSFIITGKDAKNITALELFTAAGSLVKKWKEVQPVYTVEGLPAGVYKVRIQKADGTLHYKTIIKN